MAGVAGVAVGGLAGLVPSEGATVVHSILGRKTVGVAVGRVRNVKF